MITRVTHDKGKNANVEDKGHKSGRKIKNFLENDRRTTRTLWNSASESEWTSCVTYCSTDDVENEPPRSENRETIECNGGMKVSYPRLRLDIGLREVSSTMQMRYWYLCTRWFQFNAPNRVSHENRFQHLFECHIFGIKLTAMNSGRG